MCGRYNFDLTPYQQLQDIAAEINRKYGGEGWHTGEIYPTNNAPVLMAREDGIRPELVKWGFPQFKGKGVIINARSETAPEKRMFQRSVQERRCVIPSSGFFEWDQKQKYQFELPGTRPLYMAGLYNTDKDGQERFVILTTEANESMDGIHNRMPVVLEEDMIEDWIQDTAAALSILRQTPPGLVYRAV